MKTLLWVILVDPPETLNPTAGLQMEADVIAILHSPISLGCSSSGNL
jgi:hypothetical protein